MYKLLIENDGIYIKKGQRITKIMGTEEYKYAIINPISNDESKFILNHQNNDNDYMMHLSAYLNTKTLKKKRG